MVAPLTPDNTKGWINAIWPTLSRASPLTVALLLVLWFFSTRWASREIARVHTVNQSLWERLMVSQREQIDLAWRCSRRPERPQQEEPR